MRQPDFDVAVVGGGMVGAALACALGQFGARVAIVEGRTVEMPRVDEEVDLRVSALSPGTRRMLEGLAAWSDIEGVRVSPYRAMHVWDGVIGGAIHFDAADLGLESLGYLVENRLVQAALWRRLNALDSVERLCPASVSQISFGEEAARVQLGDGGTLSARLLVGADGAGSKVRAAAAIPVRQWNYRQRAVVATVTTKHWHEETAWQRFLPRGPLALLPLADGRSSIVWSTDTEHAHALCEAEHNAFCNELGTAFERRLGTILDVGERASFPLRRQQANRYIGRRVALVGDAAHVVHPLAGQGANLGFLDAAALAEVVGRTLRLGRDPGAEGNLRRYERWRKGDNRAMAQSLHGINTLFSNRFLPVALARSLGLSAVDSLPWVKNAFARHAAGLDGDKPRLMRGRSRAA